MWLKAGALYGRHKIHEAQKYSHHDCTVICQKLDDCEGGASNQLAPGRGGARGGGGGGGVHRESAELDMMVLDHLQRGRS